MYHVMFSLYGKAWILHWKCSSESPATPPTDIITYRAQCYPGQSNRNVDHTLSITTTWWISHYQFIADYDYAHKLSAVHQLHWQCPHPMLVHHVAELVLQCNPIRLTHSEFNHHHHLNDVMAIQIEPCLSQFNMLRAKEQPAACEVTEPIRNAILSSCIELHTIAGAYWCYPHCLWRMGSTDPWQRSRHVQMQQ